MDILQMTNYMQYRTEASKLKLVIEIIWYWVLKKMCATDLAKQGLSAFNLPSHMLPPAIISPLNPNIIPPVPLQVKTT